jgi:P-type Ca2+ transporter type 2C
MLWHTMTAETAVAELKSNKASGLSQTEAEKRLAEHGKNELAEKGAKTALLILGEQFTGILILILLAAALVSLFLGDIEDAIAIIAIVILNAVLGFVQEYRAEKAVQALKKLTVPVVKVRRDNQIREISAVALVPGDLVLLEAGNFVPADGRLLECFGLKIQEAALTGESEAVEKMVCELSEPNLALGDRLNLLFMGTVVTYGRGTMLVTATGMQTELGKVAGLLQNVKGENTPLQKRISQLAGYLALLALVIVAIVFGLGLLRGEDFKLLLLTAISLAVAAVPEGLPAVVTIALALGAQRMLKRHALIRKLPAVETLGSVTVICSDKTGTLTQNRMTVTTLDVATHQWELANDQAYDLIEHPASTLLLGGIALCNDVQLNPNQTIGDPTEVALVLAAQAFELDKVELESHFPRLAEVPFDSERKRMTTLHCLPFSPAHFPPAFRKFWQEPSGKSKYEFVAITKGAVDSLLEITTQVWVHDHAEPLSLMWQERIEKANRSMAEQGLRVLGLAFRPLVALPVNPLEAEIEADLIFVGMVGLIDPARPEVQAAVQKCHTAGIRSIMITGDHPVTAQAIAQDLGIGVGKQVMTGQELSNLPVKELEKVVDTISVYARVAPEHKLKIVEALQNKGQIVAMTGDGVNDAPALKKADIGVAMGITGTDVSKEAADMVLVDDNFATIVHAIEEGRIVFANIRKFIRYILTGNTGEIGVMLIAPFLGMPLPLLPLQILWINLVTDGLPGLALSFEPGEKGVMKRPPYPPNESFFARGLGRHVLWAGSLIAFIAVGLGYIYWLHGSSSWQTVIFSIITIAQMFHVLAIRSERESLFKLGLTSNKLMLLAVVLTFALQLMLIYLPFLQTTFNTVPLSGIDLLVCVLSSSLIFGAVELEKWLGRRKK